MPVVLNDSTTGGYKAEGEKLGQCTFFRKPTLNVAHPRKSKLYNSVEIFRTAIFVVVLRTHVCENKKLLSFQWSSLLFFCSVLLAVVRVTPPISEPARSAHGTRER